jgi:hypothetical protein
MRRAPWLWAGPALLAGFAAMVAAGLARAADRDPWESAIVALAVAFERSLPLAGLAGALAHRRSAVSLPLFAAGFAAGVLAEPAMLAAPEILWRLLGPAACVAAGAALALPAALPAAALLLGAQAGLMAALKSPPLTGGEFIAATAAAALWLMAGVFLTWRLVDRPWLAVAARILASWLAAAGLLLAGAAAMPR